MDYEKKDRGHLVGYYACILVFVSIGLIVAWIGRGNKESFPWILLISTIVIAACIIMLILYVFIKLTTCNCCSKNQTADLMMTAYSSSTQYTLVPNVDPLEIHLQTIYIPNKEES
jgi:hypothetical protein